jgi:hypothetical protein
MQLKRWGIPGFRSGTRWKQILAIVGYICFALWLLGAAGKAGLTFLGLALLFLGLLIVNGWHVRSRLPLLGSASKTAAVTGWTIVAILLASAWVWAGAETPSVTTNATGLAQGSGGVGGGAPSTSFPESSASAQPAQATRPSATATETPASTATLTPTAKPTLTPSATQSSTSKPTAPPRPPPTATAVPTKAPPPPPAPNTCGAPANPWGYNFCGTGGFIYSPPANFCSYFACIPNFWKSTNGYVEQCSDSMFSHSGGRSGSCSYHGGNKQPLYAA